MLEVLAQCTAQRSVLSTDGTRFFSDGTHRPASWALTDESFVEAGQAICGHHLLPIYLLFMCF